MILLPVYKMNIAGAQNKPFQSIVNSDRYSLRYGYGEYSVNIADCILKTYQQYGTDGVSEKEFDNMIRVLCNGASASALAYRRDPTIITQICTCFPELLNTKNIDHIIKCIQKSTYPQTCINAISKTGYVFTDSQVKKLSSSGYDMLNLLSAMTYQGFMALFDNADFRNTFTQNLDVEYDTSPDIIAAKILSLREIKDKYNIQIQPSFVSEIATKCHLNYMRSTTRAVYNVHIIAEALGMVFEKEEFKKLVSVCNKFYTPGYDIVKLDKIIKYYGSPIDREFIFADFKSDIFKGFLRPTITNYDPVEDIFYIVFNVESVNRSQHIQHMLDNNYLIYDNFLLFLMYIAPEAESSEQYKILREWIRRNGSNIGHYYVENIFTFGNAKSINVLSDYKILPSLDLVQLITQPSTLKELKGSSMFLDDETERYIDKLLDMTPSTHVVTNVNNVNNMNSVTDDTFLTIYESLDQRDKDIAVRLKNRFSILEVSTIVRYRITVTKTMVEIMLSQEQWASVLSLMYISKDYDYLIDMFDIDTIMMANSYHARNWLMNNLYNDSVISFAIPNKIVDLQKHTKSDVKTLMMMPIVHDVHNMRIAIQKVKDDIRLRLITRQLEEQKRRIAEEDTTNHAPADRASTFNVPAVVTISATGPVAGSVVAPVAAHVLNPAIKNPKYADDYQDDSEDYFD